MRSSSWLALAALTSIAAAQTSTPVPCTFAPYGTTCGPTLTGSDTIGAGQHNLQFDTTGVVAGAPVAFLLGVQQINIPLGACFLLTAPLASAIVNADPLGVARLSASAAGTLQGQFFVQSATPDQGAIITSQGLTVDAPGLLSITGVAPLFGGEGALITITGTNFDPNPGNNCVFVGGLAGSARVVSASRTQLVARIGPVSLAQVGDVSVIVGRGQALPTGMMTLAGKQALVLSGCSFRGSLRTDAGVNFALMPLSNNTVPVTPNQGQARVTVTQGPFQQQLGVEAHVHCCGCTWFDDDVQIQPVGGAWTGADAAAVAAAYINRHIPGRNATAVGTTLAWGLTAGPIDQAFGSVRTQ